MFTKYEQFRYNIEMDMFDFPDKYLDSNVSQVAENHFQEYYLRPLGDDVRYVRLESMLLGTLCEHHILMLFGQKCTWNVAPATAFLTRRLKH